MSAEVVEARLDAIRTALLAGDLNSLAEHEALLGVALAETGEAPDQATRLRLRRKAAENVRLLGAVRAGLGRALRRLAELREAWTGFSTYDGRGERQMQGNPSGAMDRRF
ncbi:MAG: hypothetical protein LBE86_02260 [Gemmobacter sp.]|jgi:hypothetical protein|nr:hypothetical protein [Gemmobacter sp.]